jgi:1-acyl-sn-glycerol-3-phosphate acyltransferase
MFYLIHILLPFLKELSLIPIFIKGNNVKWWRYFDPYRLFPIDSHFFLPWPWAHKQLELASGGCGAGEAAYV